MGEVALEGMEFFAYHGYYEEEQKIGNKYEVNFAITTEFEKAAEQDVLSGTVNYEILYQVIKEQMAIPSKMLEHVGHRIIEETFERFPEIKSAKIEISKFNPPVRGVCERARVTIREER